MLIKRVKLQNIRSYVSTDVTFPEGITLLWGDIGSGKSSILLAIEFALFGVMKEVNGSSLLRKGKKQGSVELTFSVDNKEYIIKRTLKQAKDTVAQDAGFLLMDGVKYDLTATELKAKMLELLGYPMEFATKSKYHLYRYTVYTPQEQMKRILQEEADVRLDTLRKVFTIDRYKRIATNAETLSKELRDRIREKKAALGDSSVVEKQLIDHRTRHEQMLLKQRKLEHEATDTAARVEDCRKKAAALEEQLTALRTLHVQHTALKTQLEEKQKLQQQSQKQHESLQVQIAEARKQISLLHVDEKGKTAATLEKEIKEAESLKAKHLTDFAMLQERVKQLQRESADLDRSVKQHTELLKELPAKTKKRDEAMAAAHQLTGCQQQLQETDKALQDVRGKMGEQQAMISQATLLKDSVKKMDTCPTCLQKVDGKYKEHIHTKADDDIKAAKKLLDEHESRAKQLAQQHQVLVKQQDHLLEQRTIAERLAAEIKHLEQSQKELEQQQKRLETAQKQLQATQQSLAVLQQTDHSHLEKQITQTRELLKNLQQKAHMEQLLDERETHAKQITTLLTKLSEDIAALIKQEADLASQLKHGKELESQWQQARAELEKISMQERTCVVSLAETRKESEALASRIAELAKRLEEQQQAKSLIDRFNASEQWLSGFFVPLLGTMEKHVLFRIHQEFSSLFEQWFSILIEDGNLAVRLDDSFTPVIIQNGYETEMESLSGGEKTALALAYRLSLNKVINTLIAGIKTNDLIILDEPTEGFSTEQLDKMRDVLEQLGMRQVIIVSHEMKMESFADHVLRVQKHEHASVVEG